MQTVHDAEKMSRLGIQVDKIATLGNLKYDTALMLDPEYQFALGFYETIYANQGNYAKALEYVQSADAVITKGFKHDVQHATVTTVYPM